MSLVPALLGWEAGMSVTDAGDADQPYEQVNGELMDDMHEAAQAQEEDDS